MTHAHGNIAVKRQRLRAVAHTQGKMLAHMMRWPLGSLPQTKMTHLAVNLHRLCQQPKGDGALEIVAAHLLHVLLQIGTDQLQRLQVRWSKHTWSL